MGRSITTTSTPAGSEFAITKTFVSSGIPNNTQTGGAVTGASTGSLLIKEITVNTDSTGWAAPTNIEFSVDNTDGVTGAAAPIMLEVIASFGANKTTSSKDATSTTLPMVLESGKKIYIHGDDAAGTGAGTGDITILFQRVDNGATIAAA